MECTSRSSHPRSYRGIRSDVIKVFLRTGSFIVLGAAGILPGRLAVSDSNMDVAPSRMLWIESPNYGARPTDRDIDTVVIHSTAGSTLYGTVKWFETPRSQVSAHFTIGKDGTIIQHVSTYDRAWHAGESVDALDRSNVNHHSVGIELVNLNNGRDPYPKRQLESLKHVLYMLSRRHPLVLITSHENIARPKGRKSDPAGFPWEELDEFAGLGIKIVP